jgi:hypothetical protein
MSAVDAPEAKRVREDPDGTLWCPEGHRVGDRRTFGTGNLLLPCKECPTYEGGRTRIYAFPSDAWQWRFFGRKKTA